MKIGSIHVYIPPYLLVHNDQFGTDTQVQMYSGSIEQKSIND